MLVILQYVLILTMPESGDCVEDELGEGAEVTRASEASPPRVDRVEANRSLGTEDDQVEIGGITEARLPGFLRFAGTSQIQRIKDLQTNNRS